MVNRYAPWRYILLLLIIVIGAVYATPNLYGEDPALQITHRVNLIDDAELNNIKSLLDNEGIDYRSIELDGNNLLVRFDSEEKQLRAATQVREALYDSDRRYSIALNLAPATPDWLTGAERLADVSRAGFARRRSLPHGSRHGIGDRKVAATRRR